MCLSENGQITKNMKQTLKAPAAHHLIPATLSDYLAALPHTQQRTNKPQNKTSTRYLLPLRSFTRRDSRWKRLDLLLQDLSQSLSHHLCGCEPRPSNCPKPKSNTRFPPWSNSHLQCHMTTGGDGGRHMDVLMCPCMDGDLQ